MADEQTQAVVKTPIEDALMKYSEADAESIGLPSPGALNMLRVFCIQMTGTPFLPKSLADKTSNSAGTLLAVVLTGREMGFSPMQSLRAFWLSPDGRLGMYADSMMATMLKAGVLFTWEALTNEGAALLSKRGPNEYRSEFTIEDAKAAGLAQKDIWRKYPKAMLKARVIGDTFRTLCPDLGGGQMYLPEEIRDMDTDPDLRPEGAVETYHVARLEPAAAAPAPARTESPTPEPAKPATEQPATKEPAPGSTADIAQGAKKLAEKKKTAAKEPAAPVEKKPCACTEGCLEDQEGVKLPVGRFCKGKAEPPAEKAEAPAKVETAPESAVTIPPTMTPAQIRDAFYQEIPLKYFPAKSPKAVEPEINKFMKAFGIDKNTTELTPYIEAIESLHLFLGVGQEYCDIFLKDPAKVGVTSAKDQTLMRARLHAWNWTGTAAEPLARKLKLVNHWSCDELKDYLGVLELIPDPPARSGKPLDLIIPFLKVAVANTEQAFRVLDLSEKYEGMTVASIVTGLEKSAGKPLDQCTAQEAAAAIEDAEKVLGEAFPAGEDDDFPLFAKK